VGMTVEPGVSVTIVPGCKNSKSKCLAGVSYFRFPVKDPVCCG